MASINKLIAMYFQKKKNFVNQGKQVGQPGQCPECPGLATGLAYLQTAVELRLLSRLNLVPVPVGGETTSQTGGCRSKQLEFLVVSGSQRRSQSRNIGTAFVSWLDLTLVDGDTTSRTGTCRSQNLFCRSW